MADIFKNQGYIIHPSKGKIPFSSNFATIDDLQDAISKLNSLTPTPVDVLPDIGEEGVLYLLKKSSTGKDQSEEYIWFDGRYEQVGSTGVDLDNYVTLDSSQNITGKKSFSNLSVESLIMKDSAPIYLGEGLNAIKIHGDGTLGRAVVEAGNGGTLDLAIPVELQEPVTVTDSISTHAAINFLTEHTEQDGQIIATFSYSDSPNSGLQLKYGTGDDSLGFALVGSQSSIFTITSRGGVYAFKGLRVKEGLYVENAIVSRDSITGRGLLNVAGLATFESGTMVPQDQLSYFGRYWNIGASGEDLLFNGTQTGAVSFNRVSISDLTIRNDDGLTIKTVDDGGGNPHNAINLFFGDTAGYAFQLTPTNKYLRLVYLQSGYSMLTVNPNGILSSITLSLSGNLTVAKSVTFSTTLNVGAKATLSGGLEVTGETVLGGGLDEPTTISGDLTCYNNVDVTGELSASSLKRLSKNGTLSNDDVPNIGMADARYVKLELSLSDEEYQALPVKDGRALYLTVSADNTKNLYLGEFLIISSSPA